MIKPSRLFYILPLLLIACTTPEERFASNAKKLFANGSEDFGHMCGSLGEILLEENDNSDLKAVQAQVADTKIIGRTADYVDASAVVRVGATGYYDGRVEFDCRFKREVSVADRWHELLEFSANGQPYDAETIAFINALGASLAGFDAKAKP